MSGPPEPWHDMDMECGACGAMPGEPCAEACPVEGCECPTHRDMAGGVMERLREIHGALDRALGDSDILHMDDATLRREEPVQWAAMMVGLLIRRMERE